MAGITRDERFRPKKGERRVNWVRIDLEEDYVSHLEAEETKYHRIMARQ